MRYEHPQIIEVDAEKELYRCPVCYNTEDLDNYDCLGADEGCVFCSTCGTELRL